MHLLILYIYIYLTAIGLTPGGSSTAHIYTQTVHRIQRTEHTCSSYLHTNSAQNTDNGTYITITKLNMHNNKKLNL
jgi:hypothetical protein